MPIPWSLDLPQFGDSARVSGWLEKQLSLCDDEAFARGFAASCPVSGLSPEAYSHQVLDVEGEKLLVGIRFKGGNVARPFVDLIAWTGEPRPGWIVAITEAFAQFAPEAVRFRWSKESAPPWTGEVDQYLFAGLTAGTSHASVSPACDLAWYDEFSQAFDKWRTTSPLGPEVWPCDLNDLKKCFKDGHIVVATDGDRFLGLAACLWQTERAFEGWMIMEEFVVPEAQGHGLETAIQHSLTHQIPPGDLV